MSVKIKSVPEAVTGTELLKEDTCRPSVVLCCQCFLILLPSAGRVSPLVNVSGAGLQHINKLTYSQTCLITENTVSCVTCPTRYHVSTRMTLAVGTGRNVCLVLMPCAQLGAGQRCTLCR